MPDFTVRVSSHPHKKHVTLLSVKGSIDTLTAPVFEKKLRSVLGENKFKLIVDLNEVEYISSAGWGLFIREIKNIRNQKGDLVLVGMQTEVVNIYENLGFDDILKSYPDVQSAVEKHFE